VSADRTVAAELAADPIGAASGQQIVHGGAAARR
jgi:hypothetical protein